MIHFDAKTQIVVSDELNTAVADLLKQDQVQNIALIVDRNIAQTDRAQELIRFLQDGWQVVLEEVEAIEPTTDIVDTVTAAFRGSSFDLLIGIGGGSTLDLAKAVSVMAINEGPVTDFHGTGKPIEKALRKIMIPTTAGTGSEVTPGAVLVNEKTHFKRALGGRLVTPDYAVLDARLTLSMPRGVTAATGMDAVGHCIEAYTTRCANDITRMYARQAFGLVFNNLPRVLENPEDLDARGKVLLGSCLAGYAIYNSNTGACHSMAYPLGIYHAVPHGVAVGLLMPKVVEINVEKGCYLYGDLLDLVEGADTSGTPEQKAQRFAELFKTYPALKELGGNFNRFGITAEQSDFLAERGLDLTPALSNNPVDFDLEDSRRVMQQLV